ncbi:ROK family transcriptional regulator [Pelagibacterium lentulum]|uniref:Sugar kinase n=1 Tax=Pelagibacterium lentulum TaxID=2029865 RepID=A0A916VUZ0_9HYPH|nr:ROK family transcriptional regulator [Pelagibacterium lentulum]GGA38650.1 sugar kinase [Pelagibacterium lentulum]
MSDAGTRSDRAFRAAGEYSDLRRGTNQAGVRLYNERLVLSLIRRKGALPKAEIARLTGLSPQTISIIANSLEKDGLLERQAPQRGKIGQPSVPYALAADGALSFGLKIGRRSVDMILVNLVGEVKGKLHQPYPYPDPQAVFAFMRDGIETLGAVLDDRQRERLAGIGIASPFELWNWEKQIGAPKEVLAAWREIDLRAEAARHTHLPVYFYNDATAACAAELLLGNQSHFLDFLYIFVGSFLGGGVVLNGSLFPGRSGYAGAIAPMPVRSASGEGYEQILRHASLYVLAERMGEAGLDPGMLWNEGNDWDAIGPVLETWLDEVAESLAIVILSATAIIDFEAIIIDGGFPASTRDRIVEKTTKALDKFDRQGLVPPAIVPGQLGGDARALGGACLPLISNFTLDREVLFKEVV